MKKDENGQLVTTTTKSCTKKATLFFKKSMQREVLRGVCKMFRFKQSFHDNFS